MNPDDLTIALAQREQPWTVPYGENKWWVVNNEGRLKHCLAHAQKTLGKALPPKARVITKSTSCPQSRHDAASIKACSRLRWPSSRPLRRIGTGS